MCGNCEIVTTDGRAEQAARLDSLLCGYKPDFMAVTHTFRDGVYTRTGKVLAGALIIGAKHRARNIFHLARGSVWVWDATHGVRLLTAPHSEVTEPGTQRIGLVVTDIEGSNIFETSATTADDVEKEMLFPFTLPALCGEKTLRLIEAHAKNENQA